MNKLLKLTGVSVLAIVAASNANAAGYTCEELIEYTSCNDGYYLNSGKCIEGASCGAGNYLKAIPPEISSDKPEEDAWAEYGTTWCLYAEDDYWLADSQEECEAYDDSGIEQGTWYGEGFVYDSGNNYRRFAKELNVECTPCAAGTYQNAAGQYSCLTCPAGSYCGTMGLSAATLCTQGTYSMDGATECSQCPATGLTDKNGATVVATTATTGSTSPTACIVGSEYYFTDTKGTYHYKSDCEFDLSGETEEKCIALNYLDPLNINPNHNESLGWFWYGEGCELLGNSVTALAPTTEEECAAVSSYDGVNFTIWEDGQCKCQEGVWWYSAYDETLYCG